MKIEVVACDEVNGLLASEPFLREWAALHADCPWATSLQSPDFAGAWYGVYRACCAPVLALARDSAGRLEGLIALAETGRKTLTGVGGHQAEYQCWLCREAESNFAAEAFAAVQRRFPSHALMLQYLPPDTPLTSVLQRFAGRHILCAHDRPLLNLHDDAFIAEMLKRKNIRTRLNKLQRIGPVEVEHVKEVADFELVFDQIISCYEIRRIGISGSGPFSNDPLKRAFHLELMRRGLLLASVLMAGERLVSAQLDIVGRGNELHLAIGAYMPWATRFAPGKIHLLKLARSLVQQGYDRLDLTPGPDAYKEEFATNWDRVHTLTVFPGGFSRRRAQVVNSLADLGLRALRRYELEPARARMHLRELHRRPLAAVLAPLCSARRWACSAQEMHLFARTIDTTGATAADIGDIPDPRIELDGLEHLLAYRPGMLGQSHHEFIRTASQRLGDEMHVYTVAERGLQYCAWLTDDLSKVLGEQIPPAQPAKRALLFDLRSFRPAVDVHRAVLLRAISDAAALQIEELLVLVPARDSVLRLAAAQTGFSHRATLRTFTRFGRTRQHVTTHHVPLRTDNSSAAPPTSPQPTRATVNQKLFAAALTMGHCSKSIVNSFQEVPLV